MRTVVASSLILLAALWATSSFAWSSRGNSSSSPTSIDQNEGWRRTSTGWERVEKWRSSAAVLPLARIHPLLWAALQLLLSLFALVCACPPRLSAPQTTTVPDPPGKMHFDRRRLLGPKNCGASRCPAAE